MWYDNLFLEFEKLYNAEQASDMAAYMKNQFDFLGVPTPGRKLFFKPYLKESKREAFAFDFVDQCWEKSYREAQYLGIDYLLVHQKELKCDNLDQIRRYVTTKSWWDTADALDAVVGQMVLQYLELKEAMLLWSVDDDIWIRRISIDFQLKYKEKTDADLLAKIICNNFGSKEFFINKAIGWSLREYSKTNPGWVRTFIAEHKEKLAPLSVREGSKYI